MISSVVETQLKELPKSPGVYFFKNKTAEIIYIGKAGVLRNRVRQYFHPSTALRASKSDIKLGALISEIANVDWMVVDSELEALFLEAEMVRRYLPHYNILLRDDKSMVYIRIDYDSDYPTVSTTRRPLDDGARYLGPYLSTQSIKQALKLLRRIFPFATRRTLGQKRASLHYHLGLDPGLEDGKTSLNDYRANLRRLIAVIEGKRKTIEKDIEKDMKRLSKQQDFEAAARARNQLYSLRNIERQVVFSDKEFLDISKDHALNELVELLGLHKFPARIEGYDISHQQGTDVVASMVVFTNGVSNKVEYRKFKTKKEQNDDFYNMHETIARRLTLPQNTYNNTLQGATLKSSKLLHSNTKNSWKFKLPDLVLIDGGKGQLDAAIRARDTALQEQFLQIPMIGLAKREEQIVIKRWTAGSRQMTAKTTKIGRKHQRPTTNRSPLSTSGSKVQLNQEVLHKLGGFATESDDFILINLPHNANLIKLLQRIRDESHRFAVSYHSTLKAKRQTASLLDDIPGIGPETRKKLIKAFGSAKAVFSASQQELKKVVGKNVVETIQAHKPSEPKDTK